MVSYCSTWCIVHVHMYLTEEGHILLYMYIVVYVLQHLLYFQVISEQHPKSLLILDDVWSFDVAQAFAVRCRTMVTSRNAGVANGILTPQIYSVSVSEGIIHVPPSPVN